MIPWAQVSFASDMHQPGEASKHIPLPEKDALLQLQINEDLEDELNSLPSVMMTHNAFIEPSFVPNDDDPDHVAHATAASGRSGTQASAASFAGGSTTNTEQKELRIYGWPTSNEHLFQLDQPLAAWGIVTAPGTGNHMRSGTSTFQLRDPSSFDALMQYQPGDELSKHSSSFLYFFTVPI